MDVPAQILPASAAVEDPDDSAYLTLEQAKRLSLMTCNDIDITDAFGNFMATVIPWKLVELLRTNLTQQNIDISAVRLEGSGAAHCLNDAAVPIYNDLDFVLHLKSSKRCDLEAVRGVLIDTLLASLPAENEAKIREAYPTGYELSSALLRKQFITPAGAGDAWALYTIGACGIPEIDVKVVQHISRPFQFSADSFMIELGEPATAAYLRNPSTYSLACGGDMSKDSPVIYRSSYPSRSVAVQHLHNRQIAVWRTSDVSLVYGGGLLKFARFLSRDWTCTSGAEKTKLQLYMVNRFCMDFPTFATTPWDVPVQLQRIANFLDTHVPLPLEMQAAMKAAAAEHAAMAAAAAEHAAMAVAKNAAMAVAHAAMVGSGTAMPADGSDAGSIVAVAAAVEARDANGALASTAVSVSASDCQTSLCDTDTTTDSDTDHATDSDQSETDNLPSPATSPSPPHTNTIDATSDVPAPAPTPTPAPAPAPVPAPASVAAAKVGPISFAAMASKTIKTKDAPAPAPAPASEPAAPAPAPAPDSTSAAPAAFVAERFTMAEMEQAKAANAAKVQSKFIAKRNVKAAADAQGNARHNTEMKIRTEAVAKPSPAPYGLKLGSASAKKDESMFLFKELPKPTQERVRFFDCLEEIVATTITPATSTFLKSVQFSRLANNGAYEGYVPMQQAINPNLANNRHYVNGKKAKGNGSKGKGKGCGEGDGRAQLRTRDSTKGKGKGNGSKGKGNSNSNSNSNAHVFDESTLAFVKTRTQSGQNADEDEAHQAHEGASKKKEQSSCGNRGKYDTTMLPAWLSSQKPDAATDGEEDAKGQRKPKKKKSLKQPPVLTAATEYKLDLSDMPALGAWPSTPKKLQGGFGSGSGGGRGRGTNPGVVSAESVAAVTSAAVSAAVAAVPTKDSGSAVAATAGPALWGKAAAPTAPPVRSWASLAAAKTPAAAAR